MQGSATNNKPRTGEPRGVAAIGVLNFLGYLYNLFSPVLILSTLRFGFGLWDIIALYFILGLFSCWNLFKQSTWSWYLAVIMWIGEGILILAASATSPFELPFLNAFFYPARFLAYPVNILVFASIGVFKIASVAYFSRESVRKAFAVDPRRQLIGYLKSFRIGSEYRTVPQGWESPQ